MLYDNYKRKILSVGRILKVIIKLLPLIITVAGTIAVISVTFLSTKGIVSDVEVANGTVTYGEEFCPEASAFLSDVTYEYSADGETWTQEYPDKPGAYYVRAVGKASFGNKRYSDKVAFEILKRKLEVSIPSGADFVYGSHDVYAAVSEGDFVECGNFVFENINEIDENTANADITPVLSTIKIFDSKGNDITESHYDISVATLNSNVVKLPLNITVQDQNEIYNGNTFSFDAYESDDADLAVGDTLVSTYPTSIIEPGEQKITPEFQVKKTDSVNAENEPVSPIDITAFYKLNITYGTLTVKKRPLVIELSNYTAEYTDSPIEYKEYTLIENEESLKLAEGHSIKVKDSVTYPTDAGIYENPTVFYVVDKDGNDVTEHYSILIRSAYIEINKRPVKVTTSSESFVYDGKEHANSNFNCEGVLTRHMASASPYEGQDRIVSIKNAGTVENKFSIKIVSETGGDVTGNYEIEYVYGVLEITRRPVTVTTQSQSFIYDAMIHSNSDFICDALADGHTASVYLPLDGDATVSITNVGYVENRFEIMIEDEDGNYVTHNYDVDYVYGILEVVKRDIRVYPLENQSKTYDGRPLVTSEVTWTSEDAEKKTGLISTVAAHTLTVKEFSTPDSKHGDYYWTLGAGDVTIFNDGTDVTSNYNIIVGEEPAKLSINRRSIKISPVLNDKVYDGNTLTSELTVPQEEDLVNHVGLLTSLGHRVVVEANFESDSVNAGTYTWDLSKTPLKIMAGEKDVTDNYEIIFGEDTASITRRPVTLTPVLKGKVYDGNTLTSDVTVPQEEDLVNHVGLLTSLGHRVVTVFESDSVNAGTYTWDLSKTPLKIMAGEADVTDNYEITYGKNATAEITERTVYIMPEISNSEKVYDADYFYVDAIKEYTSGESDTGLLASFGHGISLKAGDKHIRTEEANAGEALILGFYPDEDATSIEDILDFSGGALSSNYNVVYLNDLITVTITRRPLTISPVLESKVYDGNKLTSTETEITSGTLVDGHRVVASFESPSSDVGTYPWDLGTSELKIMAGIENVTGNYDITFGEAEAQITLRSIVLYPNLEYSDPNDKYNGDNIESYITSNLGGEKRNEWTVSENTFTVSSAPFGDYSDAGDYSWTLDDDSDIVIKLGERDVTDNFYISYGPTATQTIEKRDITLTPRLYHRDVYDGNPLDIEILYGDSNTWKLGDGNIFVVSVFFDKYCNAGTYSLSVTDGIAEAILSYTKPVDSGFSNFTISSDIKITSGERIVTDNFNISFEPNYVEITINQRSVSFKPSDVSEVYNGDFHTASKIEEAKKSGIGMLSEHKFEYSDVEFSYTYTDESGAEQTSGIGFKGKSNESTVATVGITGGTIKIYDGTSDVTDNYVINKSTDTGNLTVLALILHVKPVVSDKVFDGEVITSSSREYEWENFDGGSYEIVIVNQAVSDGVNVNKSGYDVEFKAGDIEVWDNGENITDSFKLVFESAKAFIKPRPVYITTGSAEKEYDGTELNCHSWELHPTMNDGENVGLIEGYSKESIKVNFTGSQTDAGSSENTAIAYIDGNFTVEVVPGTLTVTPCKINIILAGNKSVYNGKPITTGIKYKIDCAVKDKIFVDITQINVINVGESFDGEDDLVYTVQWKDTGEYLDSDNYEVSVTASKIYRTQAEITVASHSFTENYEEGKVYKDNALDVTGLPEGHYFEGKATTSIKGDPNAVTTVPNEFDVNDVKIYNSEDEDVTANFKITPVFGTITVIPVQ